MDTSFSDPPPKPDHASSVGNEAGLAIGSRVTAASRSMVGSPAQPARRIAAALKIAQRIDIPLLHECWTRGLPRSEEHTSELQSLMRISYAVFCLNKKTTNI